MIYLWPEIIILHEEITVFIKKKMTELSTRVLWAVEGFWTERE